MDKWTICQSCKIRQIHHGGVCFICRKKLTGKKMTFKEISKEENDRV